jgi:hypothetical protein
MQVPRVDPVGVLEIPSDYLARPRARPLRTRIAAAALVVAFLSVTVVTTALSLGGYCLTTEASRPSPLHAQSQ